MEESVTQSILTALEREAEIHDIDLVDVEIVGAQKQPCVRVRIDHADEALPTITLDEIAQQNTWINEVLDVLDPFEGSYTLEVSSPGLARPLRRLRDFERFAGNTIQLTSTVTEGRKRYTATLLGVNDGQVLINADGQDFAFELADIKSAHIKPTIEFS